MQILKLLHF